MSGSNIPNQGLYLVTHKMCPFAQRAWLGLEESGLPFELRETELYPKPQWLLKLNSKGKVPVLVDDGRVIVESEKIVEHIADKASVQSRDSEKAVAEWRRIINQELLPAGEDAKLGGNDNRIQDVFGKLDNLILGPFVAGDTFGIAEFSAAPMLQRLFEENMVPKKFAKLHMWWQSVSQRPSFQKTKLPPGSYWWWW
eukprot:gnl/MRDRNA2_/MRDRNA2_196622_c0_seq1.p1 gnl/MRDRNA2_/MRDRNA2_196622_c0~~gnl/MRDRNA2_/MRDRNA2_196622_c0_seq1.p1  ORF type:complete len:197 (+),score=39.17 gnl/MRDRNA2_/MRDRNA2_196622_c0_seq1:110-700(+)